jgi:acetyltransferase
MDPQEHFLHRFLYPESVTVVGASRNPARIGHNLLGNLIRLGYTGRIYPVHPEPGEMLGLRTYPSVASLPEPPDLAVIGVPNHLTPDVVRECAQKGIKRLVLVAGGFSETGEAGKRVQQEMARLLRENHMRAIGPNALSPINERNRFAVSFHPLEGIKPGGLSLVFQSGLYEPRIEWLLSGFNLHLNKLIDLGNKMDVHEVDALEYLVADPETRVIGIHLESVEGGGREFLRLIREGAREKHVVVLKSGRTEEGAKAAASHTGVMVQGNDRLFDAALRQAGAIRVQGIEEFFDLCKGLERFGDLSMRGNRVAVATLPGGEGVIVTDLCQQEGLAMAPVGDPALERLRPVFPPWEIGGNPFDLGVCLQFNDPRRVYALYLETMLQDPHVDGVAVMLSRWFAKLPVEFLNGFQRGREFGKPVVVWIPGMHAGGHPPLEWLENHDVPVFPSPEQALKVLAALHRSSRMSAERETQCPSS